MTSMYDLIVASATQRIHQIYSSGRVSVDGSPVTGQLVNAGGFLCACLPVASDLANDQWGHGA